MEKKKKGKLPKKSSISKKFKVMEMNNFANIDKLMKLRIIIVSIFVLSTIGMILLFFGGWIISATLILISYIMIFGLMVKLLYIKKL